MSIQSPLPSSTVEGATHAVGSVVDDRPPLRAIILIFLPCVAYVAALRKHVSHGVFQSRWWRQNPININRMILFEIALDSSPALPILEPSGTIRTRIRRRHVVSVGVTRWGRIWCTRIPVVRDEPVQRHEVHLRLLR